MSTTIVSLILAAGFSLFVYAKLGRRIGYSNPQNVWIVVGATLIISFFIFLLLFKYVIHLQ